MGAGWLDVGAAGDPPPHAVTNPATPSASHHRVMSAHGNSAGSTRATSRHVMGGIRLTVIQRRSTLHDAWYLPSSSVTLLLVIAVALYGFQLSYAMPAKQPWRDL